MYCDQCGTEVKTTSRFCHGCGHQLQVPVIEAVSTQAVAASDSHIKASSEVIPSLEKSDGAQLNGVVQLNSGTPEIHQESSVESSGAPSLFLGAHHPWPRFFARITDMALAAPLLYLSLFYPIGEYPFIEFLLGTYGAASLIDNTWFIAVIVFVLWIPIEAAFLSAFGATFGKWAFGIRVQDSDGKHLTYGKAFFRSSKVLMFGLVFNLPIINMIACLLSYIKLVKTGSTVWDDSADANGKLLVSHQPWSLVRGLICAFTIFVVLVSGALTPVVVAKLNNNYWAGRGKLPPLASSAKVEIPSAEQPQASKAPSVSDDYYDNFFAKLTPSPKPDSTLNSRNRDVIKQGSELKKDKKLSVVSKEDKLNEPFGKSKRVLPKPQFGEKGGACIYSADCAGNLFCKKNGTCGDPKNETWE